MTVDAAGEGPDPEPVVRIRPYLRAPSPVEEGAPPATTAVPGYPPQTEPEPGADPGLVPPSGPRPFVLTAGRVEGGNPAIGLETQVTVRADGPWTAPGLSQLTPELQAIVALCAEPISVAEISARTRMHFGVTKVLVGDLSAAGHLDVHVTGVEEAHDPDIILRVIDGLRAIS